MEPAAQTISSRWTKRRIVAAAGLTAAVVVLIILGWKIGLGEAFEAGVSRLRAAGPAVFFIAMALLPAAGFPMLAFTLTAGPVFGPAIGSAWVVLWSLTAVVGNLLLSYWLANWALRPVVSRLLSYFSFRLPESGAASAWQLTLIVRLTPGPPYWVQSYLLGLIRVPLPPYLIVSTLVMAGYIVALVYGGEAIAKGNVRLAVAAIGALVASVALLRWWKKWNGRRKGVVAVRD